MPVKAASASLPPSSLRLWRSARFAHAQEDAGAASAQWRQIADQVRPKLPKLATLLDGAEEDVLASMSFPKEHRAKIHSTNPLERLNGEIKRRTEGVGLPRAYAAFGDGPARSPTRPPSHASSAPSCSSKTMSGPFSEPDT